MSRTLARIGPVLLVGLLLIGCSRAMRTTGTEPVAACEPPHAAFIRHVLYFGMSSPLVAGGVITSEVWNDFSVDVLTRHFPEGMTVFEAYGEWRRGDGSHYGEPTRVVVHLTPVAEAAETEEAVVAVIEEAKRRFDFESVLWEHSPACVAF